MPVNDCQCFFAIRACSFCRLQPSGNYLVAIMTHAVAAKNTPSPKSSGIRFQPGEKEDLGAMRGALRVNDLQTA